MSNSFLAVQHAKECGYVADDNPWAICTCGVGSPNNPAPMVARYFSRWDDWYREWKVVDSRFDAVHSSHDDYPSAKARCDELNGTASTPPSPEE